MRGRSRVPGAVLATVAALLYSSFLLSYLSRSGRSAAFVSELERPGAPYADWYRASDVGAGIAMILLAALCWPGRNARPAVRWTVFAAAIVGVMSVLDGASTMDCASATQSVCNLGDNSVGGLLRQLIVGHTLSGLIGFAAAALGAAFAARAAWAGPAGSIGRRHEGWMRVHIVVAAGIGLCGLADLGLLLASVDVGLVERVRIILVSLWIGVLPWTTQSLRPVGAERPIRLHHQGAVHP